MANMSRIYSAVCLLTTVFLFSRPSLSAVPEIILNQKAAVVTIYIVQGDKTLATGSGFVVDQNGVVATNYHVVSDCFKSKMNTLMIKTENGTYLSPLRIINYDKKKDVALIKVSEINLPYVVISTDNLDKPGDDVVVIGSPLGLETTISSGIISSIRGEDGFVQISAPISPGSSGSPVFNMQGKAIGMATFLMEGGQNLNFAIPSKYIFKLLDSNVSTTNTTLNLSNPKLKKEKFSAADYYENAGYLASGENYSEAIEAITNAINLDNKNPEYYSYRGSLYRKEKRYYNAIDDYDKAISLNPQNPDYYAFKGAAYASLNKTETAIANFNKAIAIKPEESYYCFLRGITYFMADDCNNAIRDLTHAITLSPQNAVHYQWRGFAYSKLKEYRKAIHDYSNAIALNKENDADITSQCLQSRGDAYYEQGSLVLASDDYSSLCDNGNQEMCSKVKELKRTISRGGKWKYYDNTSTYDSFFYDTTSIRRNGKYTSVWQRIEHADDTYEINHVVINCNTNKIGLANTTTYNANGVPTDSYAFDSIQLKPAIPDSVGYDLLRIVCSKNANNKTKKKK